METIKIEDLNEETVKGLEMTNAYVPIEEKINILNNIILKKSVSTQNGFTSVDRIVAKIALEIVQVHLYTNVEISKSDLESYDTIKRFGLLALIPDNEQKEWEKLMEMAFENVLDANSYKKMLSEFLYGFKDILDPILTKIDTMLSQEGVQKKLQESFIMMNKKIADKLKN